MQKYISIIFLLIFHGIIAESNNKAIFLKKIAKYGTLTALIATASYYVYYKYRSFNKKTPSDKNNTHPTINSSKNIINQDPTVIIKPSNLQDRSTEPIQPANQENLLADNFQKKWLIKHVPDDLTKLFTYEEAHYIPYMDEKILNSTMKNIQITHDDECKPLYEEKTNNPLQQAKQKYLASFINAEKSNFLIFNSEHLLSEESFKSTRNKRIVFAHHLHDNEYIIDGCIIFYKDASLDNRYFKGYPILFASLANFKAEHISVYQQIIFQKMLKKIHSLFDNKQFLYTNLLKNYEKKYHCFLRKMGGSMVFFPSLDQYYPNEKNHFVIGFENSSNSKIEKTIVQEFSVKTKNSYFEYNLEDEIKGNIECKIFDKTAFLENESDRDYYVQQILDIVCAENKKILDSSNEHSTEKKIVDFYYSNNMFFNLVLDKNYEYFDSIYSDTWIFALSKGIDEKTKVIGFLLCNKRNHELNQNENMQIDIAAVRPNMQNKGVFKAMLTCLFTHLKRTNPSEKKIQLNVKRDNVNAITAYTKTGGKEQKTQHETDNLVVFDVQKCLSKWNNTKI